MKLTRISFLFLLLFLHMLFEMAAQDYKLSLLIFGVKAKSVSRLFFILRFDKKFNRYALAR